MMDVSVSIDIRASRDKVYSFLLDYEKWMKFNPAWDKLDVRKVTKGKIKERTQYKVVMKPEGGEEEVYTSTIAELDQDKKIRYEHSNGRSTLFKLEEAEVGTRLTATESFDESSSLDPALLEKDMKDWLGSVRHYCELKKNPVARLSRFFIDKVMLRMNPYQRRIAVLIIVIQLLMIVTIVLAFLVLMVMRLLGMGGQILAGS
jgi:uncharacterized protein YndB with AHSA1/START domain